MCVWYFLLEIGLKIDNEVSIINRGNMTNLGLSYQGCAVLNHELLYPDLSVCRFKGWIFRLLDCTLLWQHCTYSSGVTMWRVVGELCNTAPMEHLYLCRPSSLWSVAGDLFGIILRLDTDHLIAKAVIFFFLINFSPLRNSTHGHLLTGSFRGLWCWNIWFSDLTRSSCGNSEGGNRTQLSIGYMVLLAYMFID